MRRSASIGAVLLVLGLVAVGASVPAAATTTRTTAWVTTSPQPAGKVRQTVPTTAVIGGTLRVKVDLQNQYAGSAGVRVFVSNPWNSRGSYYTTSLNPVLKASVGYRVNGVTRWVPMTCAKGYDAPQVGRWCSTSITVPRGASSATVVAWISSSTRLSTYRFSYLLTDVCLPNGHVGRCAEATTAGLGFVLS